MLPEFITETGPFFGLESNIAQPPFSALISIILLFGLDVFGLAILRVSRLNLYSTYPWLRWQTVLIGGGALMDLLTPVYLVGAFYRESVRWVAYLLLLIVA